MGQLWRQCDQQPFQRRCLSVVLELAFRKPDAHFSSRRIFYFSHVIREILSLVPIG